MRRWPDLLAAAAALGASAAGPAAAQRPAPAPTTIGDAITACMAAITLSGVDEQRLQAAGWHGTDIAMDEADREPLRVYHRGAGPLLVAGTGSGNAESGCNVVTGIAARDEYEAVVAQANAALHVQPTERNAGSDEILWIVGPNAVTLAPAGRPGKPAVRFTIITLAAEKK